MWSDIMTFRGAGGQTSQLLEPSPEEDGGFPMRAYQHQPVMYKEVLSFLDLKDGMVVLDATLGLGGHAAGILEKITPHGRFIGIDKDAESLNEAQEKLKKFSKHCIFVQDDFRNFDKVLEEKRIRRVDAFLFDLGISSYQLDNAARGFGIRSEGPLDMRMDRNNFISAYDLLNNLTEEEISSVLWRFGQERFSRRIARAVIRRRAQAPISSTKELAELVLEVLPYKARFHKIHPATRTFQALRIAVNRELDALDEALKKTSLFVNKGGRVCVISFHSLEDKIVKENFRELVKTGRYRLLFKKVLRPQEEEISDNPRSRSAKMRVIERFK